MSRVQTYRLKHSRIHVHVTTAAWYLTYIRKSRWWEHSYFLELLSTLHADVIFRQIWIRLYL